MSYHSANQFRTVPHGTFVYDTKANAQCFNTRGRVTNPQPGKTYWIHEDGKVQEVVAATGGVLKYKQPSTQSAAPFPVAAVACATG